MPLVRSNYRVRKGKTTSRTRTIHLRFPRRLDAVSQRRAQAAATGPPRPVPPPRPVSALGFRPPRVNNDITSKSTSNFNLNPAKASAESTLLDDNGLPVVGHLNAFTPDVIQVFQEAAKLIDESQEIKKQAMNQIRDAFNDAKAYSLTVNQSVAQKLADIITLAVRT